MAHCSLLTAKKRNMKRTLLLTLALLLSVTIFAQNRTLFIREYFNSDELPADWTFVVNGEENTGHWQVSNTHQSGGDANELKLYWKPQFDGIARVISPAVNLTGVTEMIVSFKAFLDNYQDVPHKVGIATSSDNGTTWNTAWVNTFSHSNQGQHSIVKTIATPDMEKENVQFCIFYEGSSGYINGWYFDDIEIYTLDKLNLGLVSINMPEIANATGNEITFTAKNTGATTITSFNASFQIEDNDAVVETFETSLTSLQEKQFSFQKKVDLLPGSYKLTISILDVNGEEDVTSDNVIESEINIALSSVQRKPMIEHFSSSNCAACPMVNDGMALLTEKYHDKYTYVKYPFNTWPYDDPYKTEESRVKKLYYNDVNAIPTVFFEGNLYGNTFISDKDFETAYNVPAYIDIKGAFNVNEADNTILISIDVLPFMNLYNKRLFVSVNEKTTTKNTGANGETEFHHIMMKMFPDAEGTQLDFKANEMQHFEFSYDMNNTYMEELNDLEVAVWIQDYDTFVIYNSNFMYEYTAHPYPAKNLQLSHNDNNIVATWEAPENGTPVAYNVYVNDALALENTTELTYTINDFSGMTVVKVVAIYENGKASVSVVNNIYAENNGESISENTTSLNIYPNPVKDRLYIETLTPTQTQTQTPTQTLTVEIYDIYGRRQQSTVNSQQSLSIDLSELNAGIYIIKIKTKEGNIVKQFIKQ